MRAAEDESDINDLFPSQFIPDPEPELIMAIRAHDLARVWSLLKENPSMKDEKDIWGTTALMWAAMEKQEDILKVLVNTGAKLDEKDGSDTSGRTALIWATLFGWKEGVEILIDAGANLNIQDSNGRTPLMLAVINRYASIVKVLIDAGAEPDKKDMQSKTALEMAKDPSNGDISTILESISKALEKQKMKSGLTAAVEHAARHREILKQKRPVNPFKRKPS